MRINCLSCGFKVELDDAYDDYEGRIKCVVCGTLLEIKTEDGSIRSVKPARIPVLEDAAGNLVGVG